VNRYEAGAGWRRRAFGSKARRELRLAERVAALGVPTPMPLVAGERREGARVTACYLLTPFLSGARDLRRVLAEPLAPPERRALARAFGAFVRRLHDAGIDQEDLQPNNFLLGGAGPHDLYLIDFERLALRRRIAARERELRLAKLVRELPAARRGDRARFLLGYLGDDAAGGGGAFARAWRGVARAGAVLARRDALRLRRVVAEDGRRFRRFEVRGWRGVRAAEQEAAPLEASLSSLLRTSAERPEAPAVVSAAAHFAVALPAASRRAALATFANAVLLGRRRLAPAPAAIVQRGDRALLVFEGAPPRRLDPSAPPAERRAALPALALLLESLAALGELDAPRAELVAFAPPGAPLALQLLAPVGLRLAGRLAPGGIAARRALAARLLGVAAAERGSVQGDRR
jgi:hypothetical protein